MSVPVIRAVGLLVAALLFSACAPHWDARDHSSPYARIQMTMGTERVGRSEVFELSHVNRQIIWDLYQGVPADGGPDRGWLEEVVTAGRRITVRIRGHDSWTGTGSGEIEPFSPVVITAVQQFVPKRKTVEGEVTFTPRPGGRYVVRGKLGTETSTVWLEDEATGRVIGRKFGSGL